MVRSLSRVGLTALFAYGVLVVVAPQYMPSFEPPFDKVLHFGIFAFATFLALLAFKNPAMGVTAAGVILAAGIVLEIIQSFIPGRSAEMADALVNALGAGSAMAVFFVLRRLMSGRVEDDATRILVVAAYKAEISKGHSEATSLQAAADLYRQSSPHLGEQELRLDIIAWVEEEKISRGHS